MRLSLITVSPSFPRSDTPTIPSRRRRSCLFSIKTLRLRGSRDIGTISAPDARSRSRGRRRISIVSAPRAFPCDGVTEEKKSAGYLLKTIIEHDQNAGRRGCDCDGDGEVGSESMSARFAVLQLGSLEINRRTMEIALAELAQPTIDNSTICLTERCLFL